MNKPWLIPCLILLLVSPACAAQAPAMATEVAPESLTLAEAQALALKNYPRIKASAVKLSAAKQAVKIARSNYLPQANANAVKVFADDNTRVMAGSGINNPTILDRGAYGLSVSQLITDFGHTSDLVDASKLHVDAAKSRAELTKDTVLLNVTRAYYNVLRAQALLKVADSTRHARATFLEQMTSLRKERLKSDLDQSLAKQAVQEADLLVLRAKGNFDDAESALSEALGYSDTHHFSLSDDTAITPYPDDLQPLLDAALKNNPEIVALHAEWQAASKQADAEETANYPTVSALAYAGETPDYGGSASINRNYAAAGINVSIPLYTGGRLTAQRKKASFEADAAKQELDTKTNELSRDIHAAWNNTRTAYQNIDVSKNLMQTNKEALELTQARYDLGKSSIVDLTQAQLNETSSEIAAADAQYEYLTQQALLQYTIGATPKP
jgi:outer membrane protein